MSRRKLPNEYVDSDVLVRGIHPDKMDKGRISPTAFQRSIKRGELEKSLSVACKSLDTLEGICQSLFVVRVSGGKLPVFTASRKIRDLNKAARDQRVGLDLSKNVADGFYFREGGNETPAYTHEYSDAFKSHSGIHFLRVLEEAKEKVWASIVTAMNHVPDETIIETEQKTRTKKKKAKNVHS